MGMGSGDLPEIPTVAFDIREPDAPIAGARRSLSRNLTTKMPTLLSSAVR